MKRMVVLLLPGLALGAAGTIFILSRSSPLAVPSLATAAQEAPRIVAGPGRVEPISEEIRVSAEVSGKLRTVPVEEGDRVRLGQVIAELDNPDYRARVAAAEATLLQREAEQRRVVNGARDQERSEALAGVKAAEAVLANARLEAERRRALAAKGMISREEADRYERDLRVARARHDEAVGHHATLDVEAREEDRSRAAAEVALARARLDEAKAELEKTHVRSPVSGVVLRKHRKAGESVSTMFDSPIVTVADDSRLRVRIDVDETDVGRIRPGQRAWVTADAFPARKFWGRVVRVGRLLGKKNIQTDDPSERVDTKVLETLVDLDDARELPLGLRVDAFVVPDRARLGPAPRDRGVDGDRAPVRDPARTLASEAPAGTAHGIRGEHQPTPARAADSDAAAPRTVTAASTRHWVQVGAFRDRRAATQLAERLRQGTLPVSDGSGSAAVPAGGDSFTRVRVGPYSNRGDAISALRALRAKGYEPFLTAGRD